MNILFVCTGNTCRSPMAEAYFNFLVHQANLTKQLHATSAGVQTGIGYPASSLSIHVLKKAGVDLSKHRSKPLTQEMAEEADLILAMTEDHKTNIQSQFPRHREKVYTIKEFVGKKGDVPDPIGLPEGVYQKIFNELMELVQETLKKVNPQ